MNTCLQMRTAQGSGFEAGCESADGRRGAESRPLLARPVSPSVWPDAQSLFELLVIQRRNRDAGAANPLLVGTRVIELQRRVGVDANQASGAGVADAGEKQRL